MTEYVQKYVDIRGAPHKEFIKNENYEAYIYEDTVYISEGEKIICRARSGSLICGGINILAIRGPSDELFACMWVYTNAYELADFIGVISVHATYSENITNEHEVILHELINECEEDILQLLPPKDEKLQEKSK